MSIPATLSRGYSPAMSMSDSPEELAAAQYYGRVARSARRNRRVHDPESDQELGVLRLDVHGSWSVADFTKLPGRVEDCYKAAGALEALEATLRGAPPINPRWTDGKPDYGDLAADELLQTVTAFELGGGLRLGSIHYGSPGWLTVIGSLNPLKTVADGITDNRKINAGRDEVRRSDEREREQQRRDHELQVARLQMEAEKARYEYVNIFLDRLPLHEQGPVAAQVIERLMGSTEAIANEARVDGARMLEPPDDEPIPDQPGRGAS
jgi:hypothetical protein